MAGRPDLEEYRRRRDFRRTNEPSTRGRKSGSAKPSFVIQQHDATAMHYDFRLEADGVLKSWAVPKGPSTDPREKRLAVQTEDHPLEYAAFEGVIPEGQYGAGPVLIWDRGWYENLTENDEGEEKPVSEAVDAGHVKFRLHGEKLEGGYALTRVSKTGERARWILVKTKDEDADARRKPTKTQTESVASGRSLDEVAASAKRS